MSNGIVQSSGWGEPMARRSNNHSKRRYPFVLPSVALIAGAAGVGYVGSGMSLDGLNPDCNIKGNISINTGERIYHLPGQDYYDETKIRPEFGERWFCTESEAKLAGWRRSRV